jgi:hypothetical protein
MRANGNSRQFVGELRAAKSHAKKLAAKIWQGTPGLDPNKALNAFM